MMIKRIIYALKEGWANRYALKRYINNTAMTTPSIIDLNPSHLKEIGYKALIIDYDGVLSAYGQNKPAPAVIPWLKHCIEVYRDHSLFILTNKPSEKRFLYLRQHFPSLHIIHATAKKPYPNGILQVIEILKQNPESPQKNAQKNAIDKKSLLIIDDRLLTGILAGVIAGIEGCYVTKPYISFFTKPFPEAFFWILRKLERLLVRVITV